MGNESKTLFDYYLDHPRVCYHDDDSGDGSDSDDGSGGNDESRVSSGTLLIYHHLFYKGLLQSLWSSLYEEPSQIGCSTCDYFSAFTDILVFPYNTVSEI